MNTRRRRSLFGFTIVELTVVIIILGILATVSIAYYIKIQRDARDKKREADITIIQTYLEKYYDQNGIYPAGCFNVSKATPTTTLGSCNSQGGLAATSLAPHKIGYDSTISDLRAFLPGLPDGIGDPSSSQKDYPFGNSAAPSNEQQAHSRYYYGGSHPSNGTIGSVNGPFGCPNFWDGTSSGTNPSNYFLAYWSESKKGFVFKHGRHGSLYEFRSTPTSPSYCKYTE